ncbi:MAG: hypothetical protein VW397_04685 [Candidatus Margulisiibacteriota bacterium]
MKKILIILMFVVRLTYANSQVIAGYGVSNMEMPSFGTNDMVAENIFAGLENRYQINDKDTLVISGLLSSNRKDQMSYLNELELQVTFEKMFKKQHHFGVGFHITHLLDEKFDDIEFAGSGFGLNLTYKYQIFPMISFNAQLYSNSYEIQSTTDSKFNIHTARTFISIYP